jgi:hypothetical protein
MPPTSCGLWNRIWDDIVVGLDADDKGGNGSEAGELERDHIGDYKIYVKRRHCEEDMLVNRVKNTK